MTDQPQFLKLHTTPQILSKTTSSLSSRPFTFLLLSLLLFTFRSSVDLATSSLSDLIDLDPNLRRLLDLTTTSSSSSTTTTTTTSVSDKQQQPRSLRRRRPFLHLTRVGTLDDDFFSGDDDNENRSPFGSNPRPPANGTIVILSNFRPGYGVRVKEVGRPGATFLAVDEAGGGDHLGDREVVRPGVTFLTVDEADGGDYSDIDDRDREDRVAFLAVDETDGGDGPDRDRDRDREDRDLVVVDNGVRVSEMLRPGGTLLAVDETDGGDGPDLDDREDRDLGFVDRVSEVVRPGVTFVAVDEADGGDDSDRDDRDLVFVDNGVRVSEVVRPGVTFLTVDDAETESDGRDGPDREDRDLGFLVRRDAAGLFFLVGFLSALYGWVILGFLVTYCVVLGVVFVVVVNDLLGVFGSFSGFFYDGSRLGLKRVSGFVLMRWAVRDALTQILGLWYFGEVEDQYSFFKLFVRLKLMPFSVMCPWIGGYEREVSGFLFAWFVIDTVVGFVFAVDAWVALVDSRRSGREIVREGCYLISVMVSQAVQLKCLEAVFCGSFVRWVLARACGKAVAGAFQAVVEVYFVAAWLVFYLAARCRDAEADGRRFGKRELEGLVEGLR